MSRCRHRLRLVAKALIASLIVVVAVAISALPAGAHPFLVRTDPPQGARLSVAPQSVGLEFSEALSTDPPSVSVTREPDRVPHELTIGRGVGGRVLRADARLTPGIWVVHWEVVGDDGHRNAGQFAFAVGPVAGALPRARSAQASATPLSTAVGWLFFVGLALAAGALATAAVVDRHLGSRRRALRLGLGLALVGATTAWAIAVIGVGAPPQPRHQQLLLALVSGLLCGALILWRRPRGVVAVIVGVAVAWAARGQVAVGHGMAGVGVDTVHLLAASVWTGALVLLAIDLWGSRHHEVRAVDRARPYARLALLSVLALAASGLTAALLQLRMSSDIWTSSYGRLLAAKTILLAVALAIAWRARRRGLHGRTPSILRRMAPVESAVVIVVLALAAVVVDTAPPPPASAASTLLGPPPLEGTVARDAGMAGILTVAVAAGDGRLQVEVIAPGGPAPHTRARVETTAADGRRGHPQLGSCGDGCLAGPWPAPAGLSSVRVDASAPGWRGGTFTATLSWPPAPADPALLVRVVDTMRGEPTVEMTERTSSGPDSRADPDTFIGTGAELMDNAPYAAGFAQDVRPLSGGDGLSLYLSGDRIWATLRLDDRGRLASEHIVDVGHLIDRTFAYPG